MPCFTARRGVACCPGIARSRIIKPRNTARSNSLEHDAAVVIGCIGDTSYRVSPMRGRSIRRAHGRGPAPDTHRARLDVSISGHRLTPGRAGLSELPHFDRRPAGPVCGRLSAGGGSQVRTRLSGRPDSAHLRQFHRRSDEFLESIKKATTRDRSIFRQFLYSPERRDEFPKNGWHPSIC